MTPASRSCSNRSLSDEQPAHGEHSLPRKCGLYRCTSIYFCAGTTASISPRYGSRKILSRAILANPSSPPGTCFLPPEVEAGTTAHVIDIGSGAGFPGLPAKIWAPHIHLTLIESNQKKATFLREVVRHLSLANVDVFAARAKTYLGVPGDVVMFRAVEQFESILTRCCRFGAPWRMPGCHDRKETAGYSPPALAGTAVERSNRPSTLIPSLPDHRKERTWIVTATSICGTILQFLSYECEDYLAMDGILWDVIAT